MDQATLISRHAQYYGEKTAIVFKEKRWSFREVNERANAVANGLQELGIQEGDRVATLMPNCPQFIEIRFAQYKSVVVCVGLNPRLSPEEIVLQLNDSGVKALFASGDYWEKIRPLRDRMPALKIIVSLTGKPEGTIPYEDLITGNSKKNVKNEVDMQNTFRIAYTGGTTGHSKAVSISWQNDLAVCRNVLLDLVPDLHYEDIFLGLQPLYHAVGTFILPCWIRGATHVVVPDFNPETAFPVIEKEKVTILKTVPTVLVRLMSSPEIDRHDTSSIRTILYGASPMPVEKLKEAIHRFGPIFVQNYGQAEAPMTICVLKKEDHRVEGSPEQVARLSSIGRPYTLVEVKIVDEEGKEVPPGEPGELIVKSDHTMQGYWKNPEATHETLKDGWIYTRDIGRRDEQGYIFLVDRKGEMIITGGLNVYPQEVEQVLYKHPAVLEVCAFGVPDEKWGEKIKVAVVTKPGMKVSENELIDFCKTRLASYKKPASVDFFAELPKNDTGKILRRPLRDPYWKGKTRKIG